MQSAAYTEKYPHHFFSFGGRNAQKLSKNYFKIKQIIGSNSCLTIIQRYVFLFNRKSPTKE